MYSWLVNTEEFSGINLPFSVIVLCGRKLALFDGFYNALLRESNLFSSLFGR